MPAEFGIERKDRGVDWTRDTPERHGGVFHLGHDAIRTIRFAKLLEKGLWRSEPWLIWLPGWVPAWRPTWRIAEVVGCHVAARIGYC